MVKSPNPQRKKSLLDFRKTNSEGSKQPMEIQFRFYGGKSNFMENIDKISEGNEPQSFTFDDSNPIEEVYILLVCIHIDISVLEIFSSKSYTVGTCLM